MFQKMNTGFSVDPKRMELAFHKLSDRLGPRVTRNETVRSQHSGNEAFVSRESPDIVCFVETEEEISDVLKLANQLRVAVIPFGAGTSLEGQVSAVDGGICVDVSRMNRIIRVNNEDLDAVVQPGVTREQLNEYTRDQGLFFPVDPGGKPTLGGMAATRASGTNAVRYGTMRENVLAMRTVLSDGRVVKSGSRARKSSTGYDLTGLFIGSEGTLGIISELTVRLQGIPEVLSAAVCNFEDLKSAVETVVSIIQFGIPISRAELMDDTTMSVVNDYSNLDYPTKPTLFFEFSGSAKAVKEQIEHVKAISSEFGGGDFSWATHAEDRNRIWQARHDTHFAIMAKRPGARVMPSDVCVPISRLAECIAATKRDIQELPFFVSLNGHVGDGNFHLGLLVDPENVREVKLANGVIQRLVTRALDMDGTCSGEHGIGVGKLKYLEQEHGNLLDTFRDIKSLFDPNGIMNPGKLMPPQN